MVLKYHHINTKEEIINMKLAAQIVGLIGIACSLLSFQQKKRNNVMLFQMSASALFCIQLFMVGAITGGCIDSISFVRTAVFSQNQKKWASSPLWLWGFMAAMIITGILTWQNIFSILPIIGSVLSTLALWMKKAKHIRIISLFVGPCWLIYNLIHGAYTGALNELLAMTSIIIGICRHDIGKKNAEAKEQA
jgi:hypothetical protein